MAGVAGGGGDCFFIFSVMIGWPEQMVATGRRRDDGKMRPLFFSVMFAVRQFRRTTLF
jgi:hypothetical protein